MRRTRRPAAALLLVVCLAAAGCGSGGGGGHVPRGNPDARYGPSATDDYTAVELVRALLIASSDSYSAGGSLSAAKTQLARARANYDVLAGRVRSRDPVVDREVIARFTLLQNLLGKGVGPNEYGAVAGPLWDQLMDGVSQALVSPKARGDRGVQAEALRRLTARMSADYDASASADNNATAQLAFEEAWGLWRRAQTLAGNLTASLGAEQSTVSGTIQALRGFAFPNGPTMLDAPPATKVDTAGAKITGALVKRYGLDA